MTSHDIKINVPVRSQLVGKKLVSSEYQQQANPLLHIAIINKTFNAFYELNKNRSSTGGQERHGVVFHTFADDTQLSKSACA